MKRYCDFCENDVEVTAVIERRTININGIEFDVDEKVLRCPVCGNKVYDAKINDDNVHRANVIYRDRIGLIQVSDIEELLKKYNIGKKPLAQLLGWGEVTLIRYCEGAMPKKEYSDLLKSLNNPFNMLSIFNKSKNILSEVAEKKLLAAIIELIKNDFKSKLYGIVSFFLATIDEEAGEVITPLKLQKLIYYVQAWSLGIYGHPVFNEPIVAWDYGPVVYDIYTIFKEYHRDPIPRIEAMNKGVFSDDEFKVLRMVKSVYGKYDAYYLKTLTHHEEPWIKARGKHKMGEKASPVISVKHIEAFYHQKAIDFGIKTADDVYKVDEYVRSLGF